MSVNSTVARTVGGVSRPRSREELLDLVDDGIDVADCQPVVGARHLDEGRAFDVVRDVSSLLHGDDRIVATWTTRVGT